MEESPETKWPVGAELWEEGGFRGVRRSQSPSELASLGAETGRGGHTKSGEAAPSGRGTSSLQNSALLVSLMPLHAESPRDHPQLVKSCDYLPRPRPGVH